MVLRNGVWLSSRVYDGATRNWDDAGNYQKGGKGMKSDTACKTPIGESAGAARSAEFSAVYLAMRECDVEPSCDRISARRRCAGGMRSSAGYARSAAHGRQRATPGMPLICKRRVSAAVGLAGMQRDPRGRTRNDRKRRLAGQRRPCGRWRELAPTNPCSIVVAVPSRDSRGRYAGGLPLGALEPRKQITGSGTRCQQQHRVASVRKVR